MEPSHSAAIHSLLQPKKNDIVLTLLEVNLGGPLDNAALIAFYRCLRDREHKISFSDREFYAKLRARFEQKLTAGKIEIPGLFNIEQAAPVKAEKKPVETPLAKAPSPNAEAPVKRAVAVKAPEIIKYDIRFSEHLTQPDDTVVYVGKKFTKQWKVVNPSDESVPVTCKVKSFASNNLVGPRLDVIPLVEAIKPKESATISVEMQAPDAPGTYTDYFRFISSTGKGFGDTFSCRIVVKQNK